MAITAQDVNKLRQMTGAGMMDCKKALTEAEGDFDKAVDLIRKRGQQIASKRADREAKEGVAFARVDATGKHGAIIIMNCETDFVAKNADFVALANKVLDLALAQKPANLEALLALPMDDATAGEIVSRSSGVIGEKVEVSAYDTVDAESVAAYIHFDNRLATLVGFNQANVDEQVGKDCAMQVAAMAPVAVDRDHIPAEVIEHEKAVAIEKTKEDQVKVAVEKALQKAGINPAHVDSEDHIESNMAKGWISAEDAAKAREIKATVAAEKAANLPEAMIQNIANGRVNKFFKESTLMEQEFVKNNKQTIAQYLESVSKGLVATELKRFSLGN